mmetsp:Transcript_65304/g.172266  ORF Transcript_65304/g.172266 Transcript_65304/m.172266 type:complete len:328 (-) Transcript_65304:154-1137(-)
MRATSSLELRAAVAVIVIDALALVVLSTAFTERMPLASMSKVTTTCGSPRLARSRPEMVNLPSSWHASVEARSPSKTQMSTSVCQSSSVVNVSDLRHGMAVLRFTTVDMTLPVVSMPSESGTTSISTSESLTLASCPPAEASPPLSTPACTAAPYATASSGLIVEQSSLPSKNSESNARILGTRVEPPTSTTSCTSALEHLASRSTCSTGSMVFLKRSMLSSSKRARERVSRRSTPSLSASSSIDAEVCVESERLRSSHARRSRCIARLSLEMSSFALRWKTLVKWFISLWSKSSPPRWVSPAVAFTSKTPSSIVSSVTSNVPPPRS